MGVIRGNLSKKPWVDETAQKGDTGVGVEDAYIDDGILYIVLTDGNTINAGNFVGAITSAISTHNQSEEAHEDIRGDVSGLSDALSDHASTTTAHGINTTVSGAINTHNTSKLAHDDIRDEIDKYKDTRNLLYYGKNVTPTASSNFVWNYNSTTHTATVTQYDGSESVVVIPYEVYYNDEAYRVTSIAASAFDANRTVTAVIIPTTVTSIGNFAFDGSTVTSMEIPCSVSEIGREVFASCYSLATVTIPKSVTAIGDGAFFECTALTDVYYEGSEDDWGDIDIGEGNSSLTGATIHYNHRTAFIDFVEERIASAISNVYKVKGTKTVAQINALTNMAVGDVYNVSDSGTIGTISVSAGDNVVYTADGWDKLSTTIDLSVYYTKTQTDSLLSAKASQSDVATSISTHNVSSSAHQDIRNKFKNADYYGDINIEPTDIFDIGVDDDAAYIGGIRSGVTVPATVVVPAEYESGGVVYPVRYVYDSAILNTSIETLILPNTITALDGSACSGCINLTTVVLAKGISFGNSVFSNAPLQNIYFRGTKAEWEAIPGLTAAGNENIATATKHYDYIPSLKNGYYTNSQTQSTVVSAISTHNTDQSAHEDIREDLTDLTNSIYESNTRELPLYSTNKVKLRLSQDQRLFSGTHNIISLYGIAQGAYTYGGVTITVTGNTVSFEGTATESWNYSFIDGIKVAPADLSVYDAKPFPEGRYGISAKKISGNQASNLPSLILKQKTTGNIVTVQNTTANIDYAYNTCGKIYTYIRSGITYDFSMALGLFPYEITASETYLYETSECEELQDGLIALKGYTWGSGITSIDELKEKTQKKMYVTYAQTSNPQAHTNELIYVLIPAKTGYVRITLGHTIDNTTSNANVWRIDRVDAIEDDMNTLRFPITTSGETEMALKIYGRDDFIGGSAHGDEIMDTANIRFVIDGQIVDITEHTTYEPVESFKMVRTSSMYDPSDSETKVGTHGVMYEFTGDGVELLQSVVWDGAYELDASYMPMVCAVRGNDSVSDMQITDTYIDDGNYIPYDVSEAGFTTYPYEKKSDVKKIMLGSAESGVLITYEIVEQTGDLPGQKNFLSNNEAYNKIYNAICGFGEHHTTVSGEKWRSRAKIKFEVGK